MATMFLNAKVPNEYIALELLERGVCRNDLFCISLLYSEFFFLEDVMLYEILDMESNLEFGRKNNFWLSFYQSVDLIEQLGRSIYKDKTFIEQEKPIELLMLARENYYNLPRDLTNITLSDIEKKLMLLKLAA